VRKDYGLVKELTGRATKEHRGKGKGKKEGVRGFGWLTIEIAEFPGPSRFCGGFRGNGGRKIGGS